jgi:hypothetical protein
VDQVFRWVLTGVLLLSLVYFLWHSVSAPNHFAKSRDLNELVDDKQNSDGVGGLRSSSASSQHLLRLQRVLSSTF